MSGQRMLLLVVMVVGLVTACCAASTITQNPDTPDYVLYANKLFGSLKDHINSEMEVLKEMIASQKQDCVPLEQELVKQGTQQAMRDMQAAVMEALDRQLQDKAQSLSTVMVEALDNRLQDKTQQVVQQLERNSASTAAMQEVCGRQQVLTEALKEGLTEDLRVLKVDLEHIKKDTQHTKDEVDQCSQQVVMEAVSSTDRHVELVAQQVQRLVETDLDNKLLQPLTYMIHEVFNNTQAILTTPTTTATTSTTQPPPPTTETTNSTTTTPEPPTTTIHPTTTEPAAGMMYPCRDSSFRYRGRKTAELCNIAVIFKRCELPFISYHCCQTCTRHGQLPEVGPWRYTDMSRILKASEIIRNISP